MNERIKELYDKFGLDFKNFQRVTVTESAMQYFAQLIAQECANICMEMYAKCAGLPGDGALAKDCAYWIKKDFGVE